MVCKSLPDERLSNTYCETARVFLFFFFWPSRAVDSMLPRISTLLPVRWRNTVVYSPQCFLQGGKPKVWLLGSTFFLGNDRSIRLVVCEHGQALFHCSQVSLHGPFHDVYFIGFRGWSDGTQIKKQTYIQRRGSSPTTIAWQQLAPRSNSCYEGKSDIISSTYPKWCFLSCYKGYIADEGL